MVSDAAGTHHGLKDVRVNVSSTSTGADKSTTTSADGSWSVKGLPAGTDYQVCFWDYGEVTGGAWDALGYLEQCYNNQSASGTPTPVGVALGVNKPAVNAALKAAGALSGMVSDAAGSHHGLARVDVYVSSAATGADEWTSTAADGSWSLKGLLGGTDYQVCFYPSRATGGASDAVGYLRQCYNNQSASGTPTPVTVVLGVNKPAVNAALVAAGALSGIVSDAAGTHHGLASVDVYVSSAATGVDEWTSTAADGSWSVKGLPAGTDYQVCFRDYGDATGGAWDAVGYLRQCYNNQSASGTPTPVTVALGVNKPAVNAALVAAGALSGTVTDAAGTHHGLMDVQVNVSSASTGASETTWTDADGSWSVTGLPAGADYQVCFNASGASGGAWDTTGYLDQCWQNKPASGTPTPVALTSGGAKTAINAALVHTP